MGRLYFRWVLVFKEKIIFRNRVGSYRCREEKSKLNSVL